MNGDSLYPNTGGPLADLLQVEHIEDLPGAGPATLLDTVPVWQEGQTPHTRQMSLQALLSLASAGEAPIAPSDDKTYGVHQGVWTPALPIVSTSPPPDPAQSQLWWDPSLPALFIWYDQGGGVAQWVSVSGSAGIVGGTGTVTRIVAGVGLNGGTITTSGTIDLANTAVTPGTYTNTTLTVDQQGRLTSASSGTSSSGVTSIIAGVGLNGGTITSAGTISLANTTVTAGSYTTASITVDAQGRITAASSGAAAGSVSSVGTGTGLTGGPVTSVGTIALANTAVTAGTYTLSTITVDAQGRITHAASGTAIVAGPGLSGGTITNTGTVSAQWQAGTVTALGTAVSASGGTLQVSGLTFTQLPASAQAAPIVAQFTGMPGAGAVVSVPVSVALTVPSGLAGTAVYDAVQTTLSANFLVNQLVASSGAIVNLGTVTVTSGSHTSATLTGTGGALAAGDVVQIVAPTPQDATLAGVSFSVLMMRT